MLIYGIPQTPTSLDPVTATDLIYYQIAFNIFETLITINREKGQFRPALARAWHSDSTGLCWTFSLRPDVMFHDGSHLNAEAVKISFERQFNTGSLYFRPEVTNTFGQFAFGMLKEIRVLNDSTVQFILKYPYSAFLDNLATPKLAAIVSASALKTSAEQLGHHPAGTGPFQFVRWEADRKIVIKKFSQYWGNPPQLDSVVYRIVPNLETRVQALQDGHLDVISGLSAASVDQLNRLEGIHVVETPILGTTFLGFNCQKYPFSDVKVRQAVARALDKKALVLSVSRGLAIPARGPLPPTAISYDTTLTSLPYDTSAAKALLQNSCYVKDSAVALNYFIETDTLRASPMVQGFKYYLKKAGMDVNIVPFYDWQKFLNNILSGSKAQLFWTAWSCQTPHPDNFLYSLFHSRSAHNFFKYENTDVDSLLEQARRAPNNQEQHRLYKRVQEIIMHDVPAVFISHPKAVYAIRDRVKNFRVDPLAIPWLNEVRLEDAK
ncbi:MAG: ABC transporter substrate-binding protein [bacterium]